MTSRTLAAALALALTGAAVPALAAPAATAPAKPAPAYTPAYAPPPPPAPAATADGRAQFGLGIAIVPFSSSPVELYMPIMLTREFRLEPSLGISIDNGPSGGTDRRDVVLGVGGFLVRRISPAVDFLLGGRLKLNFAKVSGGGNSQSGTDVYLAAAAGGELFLAPQFSLGLEGDLGFISRSQVSGDRSGLLTTGLAFLRVYL